MLTVGPSLFRSPGDAGDRLDLLHPVDDLRDVCLEVLPAWPAQHELILVGRNRRIERQILFGLQVERDARDVRDLLLNAPCDLLGAERAVVDAPEIDQKAAVVQGRVRCRRCRRTTSGW